VRSLSILRKKKAASVNDKECVCFWRVSPPTIPRLIFGCYKGVNAVAGSCVWAGVVPGMEDRTWFREGGGLLLWSRQAGCPPPGPGGKQIQIEDPDGNPIELFEPARR
jgi:hypothetical protein